MHGHTELPMRTVTMNHPLFQELTTRIAMEMSLFEHVSIFAVFNGRSFASVEGRVHNSVTQTYSHVHQNHEKWFTLWAHSFISEWM